MLCRRSRSPMAATRKKNRGRATMRHRVAGKKLSRTKEQRLALRRTLITDLFRYGALTTTEAQIEAIRGEAEKIITAAKRATASGDSAKVVAARRLTAARLTD